MSNHHHSSPLPSCFRPTTTTTTTSATDHHSMAETAAASPPISCNPNLTTCLYNTDLGLFALTWSRNVLGRSLHLHLLPHSPSATAAATVDQSITLSPHSLSSPSFHLHIKPFFFWNKHGSKKLNINTTTSAANTTAIATSIKIFWDLSRAEFGSRPEPKSAYFVAVVADGQMVLLVGDSPDEAYAKTRTRNLQRSSQVMVLRREHVYGNKLYTTKASFGGKTRDISIDCRTGDDPRLYLTFDRKRVLKVKHLKWKFRGNERIQVDDGVYIQVSWDVYSWLFEDDEDGYALFMFRFEKQGFGDEEDEFGGCGGGHRNGENGAGAAFWSRQSCGFGFEKKKMKKRLLMRTARSSSSSSASLSSASSGCSSVMEWASVEENELKEPSGFSLLVYAWKS